MRLLVRAVASVLLLGGALIASLAYCPAQLLKIWLPATIEVSTLSGTVLHGSATDIRIRHVPVGDLSWRINLSSLLLAHPAGNLEITHAKEYVRLDFDITQDKDLRLTHVDASVSLALLSNVLISTQPRAANGDASWVGILNTDISSATIRHGWPIAIDGRLTLSQLQPPRSAVIVGSYELAFSEPTHTDGTVIGHVHDVEGLLKVAAELKLQPSHAFNLHGDLSYGPNAPEELRIALGFLGVSDPAGPHDFEITGTY